MCSKLAIIISIIAIALSGYTIIAEKEGPQGLIGPAGAQGPQGLQGIQDPQGEQGPAGDHGP
jgi:hypothetical protein